MVQDTRIAPRRDELITSDNRMTRRFAEFLEEQADTVNSLDEKSGVQDSLIALSNRQRGKITALEQEVEDLKEMIFEVSARKPPTIEDETGDARFALNVFSNKLTGIKDRLDDIEAEAGHIPKIPKSNPATVLGPSTSTDNAIARFDGVTGVLLQNSGVIIDDSSNVTSVVNFTMSGDLTGLGNINMTTTATSQLILPSSNDAVSPTLAFGDGDTGFYETNDDDLTVGIAGTPISIWSGTAYSGGTTTANPSMLSEVSSATNPVWSFVNDNDTGIGRSAANGLSLIAGGVEVARATTTSLDFNQDLVAADGKGIDFSALTDGSVDGTTTSQILLDYEEGTWTPILSDGTNDATHTVQNGTYTKIGRMVHVKCRIVITSLGSASGALRVEGLPYTSLALTNTHSTVNVGYGANLNITAGDSLSGFIADNNAFITLQIWNAAGGVSNMTDTLWSSDGQVMLEATYYV